jgi:hypothetical protein
MVDVYVSLLYIIIMVPEIIGLYSHGLSASFFDISKQCVKSKN